MSHYPPYSTTGTTYPYAGYHPQTPGTYAHAQTPAAYPTAPYQPYAPPTAVTSYGTAWPYHGYSYYPQQQQQQAHTTTATAPKPATTTTPAQTTTTTTAPVTATPAVASSLTSRPSVPSSYTFTSYNRDPGLYTRSGRKGSSYRGLFTKELRNLMYGFGDDRNPANDTVNVMEEILIEYIVDVCQTASGSGKKSRLSIEDLRRALSRPADAKKLARLEELLFMQEDIKRARAQFDEPDMHPTGSNI
ncbi:TFIID-18kDa-domain-containing protein [Lentinus tigrinus ALCF2SS1-7]|uniref:Transcription initiation factor TFIID subunit 13 n=1 Tax=Lentinus tigrinus ALCF2SS1-6 TaxID=1328759 RepID=A0A5C2SSC2_9APHY|nr:TFIID-18kDa-domain-containing protein [Lentinus tigrinus ALCF2SS1-6]RPD80162.1 TFIID-18kDa-domain-containing protein [Lentinus tigrinus ALCF2SS1-7]